MFQRIKKVILRKYPCAFGHDFQVVPLDLKEGIEPTRATEIMAILLGDVVCTRCGKAIR